MIYTRLGLALLLVVTAADCASAQGDSGRERPFFFYRGRSFGSEAMFNPLVKVLHGGYYILDNDNRSNNPFIIDYETGIENVVENLANPFGAIGEYGWKRFLTTEVLPNPRRRNAQWVPNYFGHIIGEGMTFRLTEEWFRFYGYRHPGRLALVATLTQAMLNEVVENGSYRGSNVDPIADMYIFNPIGILLFRSDRVAGFFSNTLNMAYWPRQLAIDPFSGTLENVGHDFVFKFPVRKDERLNLFASYGTHSLIGLAFRRGAEHTLSIGGGVMAKTLVDAEPNLPSRSLTATIVPALGFYYDRDNSLLGSLVIAPRKDDVVTLNVYPGVIRTRGFSPGLSVAAGGQRGISVGLHLLTTPVGLALHARP